MSAEAGYVRKARISRRFSVEVTATRAGVYCVWNPAPPARMTRKEYRLYEALRNSAVAELAANLGEPVIVAEVNGGFAPE